MMSPTQSFTLKMVAGALIAATAVSFSPASAAAAPYGGAIKEGIPIYLDHNFDGRTDKRCTLGAIIRYGGTLQGVTARHCVVGRKSANVYAYNRRTGRYFYLGPTGRFWYDYDLVLIELNRGQAYVPRTTAVYFATAINRPAEIYKVGSTTGVTYGTIEPQKIQRIHWNSPADEYMNTSNNLRVFNWSANIYTQPGDSGGPVYYRNGKYANYVFGIVSGWDGKKASIAPLAPIAGRNAK